MIVLFVQLDPRCSAGSVGTLGGTCRVVPPNDLQTPFFADTLKLTSGLPP